ncbi:MAG: DUF2269 domain-containing protein [Planctomycetes bacterium]|nr:DUF2269 domain-containing protein [Planctomycetota bacterium]
MPFAYQLLKTAHILLAASLLGAGLCSVFFKVAADRTGDARVVAQAMRAVVRADFCFIFPAILGLPLTGFAMLFFDALARWPTPAPLDIPPWIYLSLVLYLFAGAPWVLAVRLQLEMRQLAESAAETGAPLPQAYAAKSRRWAALGVPSFSCSLFILYVMVTKVVPWL